MEPVHINNLQEETEFILQESRIVVPGLQALFGFQLIAVFNQSFSEKLSRVEQEVHLCSILLIAIAMILVMAPTALHRVAEHGKLTNHFVKISSRLLKWAMFFLPIGISLDFYLISRIITHSKPMSATAAGILLGISFCFWFLYPRYFRTHSENT